MREIGSEFWDIPLKNEENFIYPGDCQWLFTGRGALSFIIEDIRLSGRKAEKAALPAWCCESMVKPFLDAEIDVCFYPVYPGNGGLMRDFSGISDCDILLDVEYFGFEKREAPDFPGIVIRDATHSIFRPDMKGDYIFGSLRKWAGFSAGAFVRKAAGAFRARCGIRPEDGYGDLRSRAMAEKRAYIEGRSDSKAFLSVFSASHALLENAPTGPASAEDIYAARHMDGELIIKKRRENAAVLTEALPELTVFSKMDPDSVPLFVPVIIGGGKRDGLRKKLTENSVYCPVHWPLSPVQRPDGKSGRLYSEELSLVCDQRYSPEDMKKTVRLVREYLYGI